MPITWIKIITYTKCIFELEIRHLFSLSKFYLLPKSKELCEQRLTDMFSGLKIEWAYVKADELSKRLMVWINIDRDNQEVWLSINEGRKTI